MTSSDDPRYDDVPYDLCTSCWDGETEYPAEVWSTNAKGEPVRLCEDHYLLMCEDEAIEAGDDSFLMEGVI